jgi:drug/metabolite transporter (DMT)-like permease
MTGSIDETDYAARGRTGSPHRVGRGALRRPSARATAILALVAANLIWGTSFVATKPLLDGVPPLTLAAGRVAVALLVLLLLLRRIGARPARGWTPAVMGFTGVFLLYLCQNVGLQHTSAANAALILGGLPVLTALLAGPVLSEPLAATRLVGIAASLAGLAAIVVIGGGAGPGRSALGDALLLVSALSLAAYLLVGRRTFPGGGSLELVAGATGYGLVLLLPASAAELALGGMDRPTLGDLAGLLYLGVAATALAFVLLAYGLHHLEAGQVAAFAYLKPVVGVGAAAILVGEPVTTFHLGAAALILGGVWLVTRHSGGDAPGHGQRSAGGALRVFGRVGPNGLRALGYLAGPNRVVRTGRIG